MPSISSALDMNIVHVSKGEDYPFNKYSGMANKVEHQDRELQDASIETKASSLNCDNVAPSPKPLIQYLLLIIQCLSL